MARRAKQEKAALPSGRFLIRTPKRLHAALRKMAEDEGVSMSLLVMSILSAGVAVRETLERECAKR